MIIHETICTRSTLSICGPLQGVVRSVYTKCCKSSSEKEVSLTRRELPCERRSARQGQTRPKNKRRLPARLTSLSRRELPCERRSARQGQTRPKNKRRLPAWLTSLTRRELPCERRSGSRGGGGRERDYGQRIGSLPRWIAAT